MNGVRRPPAAQEFDERAAPQRGVLMNGARRPPAAQEVDE